MTTSATYVPLNRSRLTPKGSRLLRRCSRLLRKGSRLTPNRSRLPLNNSRVLPNRSRVPLNDSRPTLNDSRLPLNVSRPPRHDSHCFLTFSRLPPPRTGEAFWPSPMGLGNSFVHKMPRPCIRKHLTYSTYSHTQPLR